MSPELLDTIVQYAVRVVGVIVILVVAFVLAKGLRRKVGRQLGRSPRSDETLNKFLANLIYYAVLTFAVLACLSLFGVNVTSFVAVLAAAGFAIGLAFQGTLSSFAAGVMLLVFRPFKVGDVVTVAGTTGKVDEVGLFTTTLDTPDNRRFIIPNAEIAGTTIENLTFHDRRRVDVAVGTDYDADLVATREVLERVVPQVQGVLSDPAPQVYLSELGGSSINWSVRGWAASPDYWAVKERLGQVIKDALDVAGIGIPYPQMDVHLDGGLERDGHGEREARAPVERSSPHPGSPQPGTSLTP